MLRLAVACSVAFAAFAANPVLPGDYPDPSVIRVGSVYWATATTSQWAPVFPLLRSTDLRTWRQVGAVFEHPPEWSEQNYWAPEIAQHNGRYFVYYTAKKKDGPLCVAVATAARPEGPYKDHGPMVCQEVGSIDAVPVDDENGRRYLIWKEDGNSRGRPTPLWAQPLSADGTKLEGERRELFRNDAPWEGQLIEGPFVVRRDGWFYLFYSGAGCCGRKCNYALGVARAKALLGPWEKNPANPILSGSDHWACPGHGSVVDDRKGRTWLLYHAYDPKTSVYVGRQGMLAEVTWKDGWPAIDPGPQPPGAARTFADEFGAKRLAAGWLWPRNQRPQLRVGGGLLTLAPEPARKEKLDGAVVGRLATAADYQAQTAVSGNGGLAIYGNEANAAGIAVDGNRVSVWRREGGKHEVLEERELTAPGQVRLRVAVRGGDRFRFAYSSDGTNWTELGGEVKGEHLPPWDLAPRVALTAAADARFDYFRVQPQ